MIVDSINDRLSEVVGMLGALDDYRARWHKAHRFGLDRSELRIAPMSAAMADAARQDARDHYYGPGRTADLTVGKLLRSEALAAIDAAVIGGGQ